MKMLKVLSCIGFLLVAGSGALAVSPEARGTAMGGAYSPFAQGPQGMWWNPAALPDTEGLGLLKGGIMVGGGLDAGNNVLKMAEIPGTVQGVLADDQDKIDKLVGKIRANPDGVWNAAIDGVGGAAACVRGFGLSFFPQVKLSADNVTPDLVKYALEYTKISNGTIPLPLNATTSHYDLGGDIEQAVYYEIGLGYGMELPKWVPGIGLSAGADVKYYLGTSYMKSGGHQVIDYNGGGAGIPTYSGDSTRMESKKGNGLGFDLGVHASLAGMAKGSIVLKNIGSQIKWTGVTGDRRTMAMNPTTHNLDTGTSFPVVGEVTQKMPMVLLLGVGGTIPMVGTSAVIEMETNATKDEIRPNEKAKMRFGLEQKIVVLAIRAGYVTKTGASPAAVSLGLGLGALGSGIDLACGMATNQKSMQVSLSGGVSF
jgi:hypothetical protein